MSKRKSIVFALALLFFGLVTSSSSCTALDQIMGPGPVAKHAFEQWAVRERMPHRDVRYEVRTSDGTFATIGVVASLRMVAEADWQEYECEIECRNVGGEWRCEGVFHCNFMDVERRRIEEANYQWSIHALISGEYGYYMLAGYLQRGGSREAQAREHLDGVAQLIAAGEYELGEVAEPQLIARLIADYAEKYGFSLDDLQDSQVREEVEHLLESGDY